MVTTEVTTKVEIMIGVTEVEEKEEKEEKVLMVMANCPVPTRAKIDM